MLSSRRRSARSTGRLAALALAAGLACTTAPAWAAPPAPGPSGAKRYLTGKLPLHEPRDRRADVTHMALELTLLPKSQGAKGVVTYRGVARAPGAVLTLYARDLALSAVSLSVGGKPAPASTRQDGDVLRLPLAGAKAGTPFAVTLRWSVTRPAMGLTFIAKDADEPDRPDHIWTQGETHGARHWLPSPDDPDERLTWDLRVTAPKGWTVLSNGEPLGVTGRGRTRETRYRMPSPYPVYLLNVAAGPYVASRHPHKRVRIESWADKRHTRRVAKIGRRTGQMLDLFEKLTGTRYPHPRYGHLYVDEFVAGGMENITLTTLTTRAVGSDATDHDRTIEGLLAHELAHQWFGDLVTCRTWADLWLNEGFATYYQKLWTLHALGPDRFAEQMAGARRAALGADRSTPRPVVTDRYRHPSELFDGHAYPKGAWVLHMLRERLGHAVFDAGIARYLKAHRHTSVETVDLRKALEAESGRSLRGFFQRWLRQPGAPRVTAKLQWRKGQLHVHLQQTQGVDGQRPLFRLPVEVAVATGGRVQVHKVLLDSARASLDLPMPQAPSWVMVDPDMRLLVAWKIKGSPDLLRGAARHAAHADARYRAVEALKGQLHRRPVVRDLLDVLRRDKARHVRAHAAKVLGAAARDAVRAGLQRALRKDPESVVRRAAAAALGQHRDMASLPLLTRAARKDASPSVRAAALRAVFAVDRRRSRPLLLEATGWPSFGHRLQGTALMLLARLADPRDLDRIWDATRPGHRKALRAQATLALAAYASRIEAVREAVREHLEGLLHVRSVRFRHQVVSALGALSEPASRGPLRQALTREPYFRLAGHMRRVMKGLGKKLSADKRIKKLEEALERLERQGTSPHHKGKPGDRAHGKDSSAKRRGGDAARRAK